MATGHSILDTLNATSKGGQPIGPSGKFRTKDLQIDQLYRNDANFYAIVDVEELAGHILMAGLLENLTVVYEPCDCGQYRIVSGERRWEALKLLVSQGHTEFAVATCNVRTKRSAEEETIDLIVANSQRVKSVADQLQEYTALKTTLERMRANGQQLDGYDLTSGRLRDVIAAVLGKSATKIGQLERINGHLIPELRAVLDSGGLKFSAAYKLAGMDAETQRDAYQRAQEDGREITHKEAERAADTTREPAATAAGNPYAASSCEMVHGACEHYPVITANFARHGDLDGCAGCCQSCKLWRTCDYCCEIMAARRPQQPSKPQPVQQAQEYQEQEKNQPTPEQWREATQPEPAADNGRKESDLSREDADLFEMLRYAVEASGLPDDQQIACQGLLRRMERRMDSDTALVAALLEAFRCVDDEGVVRDCVGYDEKYTPGEIMDVILTTVDELTDGGAKR